MPPVFGPASPSRRRLWSRAAGRATAAVPSHRAMMLASGPSRRSSRTTRGTPARPSPGGPSPAWSSPSAKIAARAASASSSDEQTATPLPAARPSALTTTPLPAAASSLAKTRASASAANAAPRAHRDPGCRRDLAAERLAALDPGGCRARPEDREPGRPQRVGHASGEGRLGPDHDEVRPERPGRRDDGSRIGRPHAAVDQDAGQPGDCLASRHREEGLECRLGHELPGERVLASPAPDQQDPPRHGHRRHPPRPTVGRSPITTVWVRSGPTETRLIGTPASSSSAFT